MSDSFDPFGGPRPTGPAGDDAWAPPPPPEPPPAPEPPAHWVQAPPAPPPAWGHAAAPPLAPPADPGERPRAVRIAVALMWIGALLSIVGGLAALTMQDEVREVVREELDRQDPNGEVDLDEDLFVDIALVASVAGGVLGAGLWILNAVFCGRGHGWSRVLSTVLYLIQLASSLLGLVQPSVGLTWVVSLATLGVATGAIVLLWRGETSRWFTASDAWRRAHR